MSGLLSLALVASLSFVEALQDSDVQAVFPSTTDLTTLTSGSFSATGLDVTAIANSSHVLVVCNRTGTSVQDVGWIGHGLGTAMATADILVLWPNPDDTWTFSHREPALYIPPMPVSGSQSYWEVVPQLTSNWSSSASWTSVAFVRPLSFPASANYSTKSDFTAWEAAPAQSVVWSYADANPQNSSPEAMLDKHDDQGKAQIDLSRPYVPGAPGAGGASAVPEGPLGSRYNTLVAAHMVIGTLVFLVISPLAILLSRHLRHHKWFQWHFFLQVVTSCLIWLVFGLGYAAASLGNASFSLDRHHSLGLALPLLVLAQSSLGLWGHWSKRDWSRARPVKNWCHVALGILVQALGYVQVMFGLDEWDKRGDEGIGRRIPKGVTILYAVVLALETLAYLVGIALSPRTFMGRPHANSKPVSGLMGKQARSL